MEVAMQYKESKIFGYVRVSSKDQNLNRQIDSLRQFVPNERDIFADKVSGKDFFRPKYQALKNSVRHGDTIYIHEMERLGRNKREIKEELEFFKESGVIVRILNLPTTMIDYNQFDSKLQQTLMEMVNNILIEVLATMAETERDNIRKRQREGIDSAKRRGTKFGRPKKDFPASWSDDVLAWKTKKITAVALMRKYQIASSTFYKKVKEYEYQESCGKGYMTRGRM